MEGLELGGPAISQGVQCNIALTFNMARSLLSWVGFILISRILCRYIYPEWYSWWKGLRKWRLLLPFFEVFPPWCSAAISDPPTLSAASSLNTSQVQSQREPKSAPLPILNIYCLPIHYGYCLDKLKSCTIFLGFSTQLQPYILISILLLWRNDESINVIRAKVILPSTILLRLINYFLKLNLQSLPI